MPVPIFSVQSLISILISCPNRKKALKAEEIDKEHDQPLLQFLLAQIYEAKHDSTAAAVYFRECRKLAQDSSNLKKELSEAQNPK